MASVRNLHKRNFQWWELGLVQLSLDVKLKHRKGDWKLVLGGFVADEVGSIWDRSQFALRKCSHSFRSISVRHSSVHIQIAFDLDQPVLHRSNLLYTQCKVNGHFTATFDNKLNFVFFAFFLWGGKVKSWTGIYSTVLSCQQLKCISFVLKIKFRRIYVSEENIYRRRHLLYPNCVETDWAFVGVNDINEK